MQSRGVIIFYFLAVLLDTITEHYWIYNQRHLYSFRVPIMYSLSFMIRVSYSNGGSKTSVLVAGTDGLGHTSSSGDDRKGFQSNLHLAEGALEAFLENASTFILLIKQLWLQLKHL